MKFKKIKIDDSIKDIIKLREYLSEEVNKIFKIPNKLLMSKNKINLKNRLKMFIIQIRIKFLKWELQKAYEFRNRVIGDMFMSEAIKQIAEKDIVNLRSKIYKLEEKMRKVVWVN